MSNKNSEYKFNAFERALNGLEKLGNLLPSPFTIFFILFVVTAIASFIVSLTGIILVNPASEEIVMARNLFSVEGVTWLLQSLVSNFTGYAPFGLVLVMTLGIGLCEEVGLVNALIRRVMVNVPKGIVPFAVVAIGLCANIASDSAMVVVPPLAAIVYLGVGRHPIAGMLTGYAGATLGYASNFLISGTDSLIAGITTASLQSISPGEVIDPLSNYYFKLASTVVLVILFGCISTYLIEPRLGVYKGKALNNEGDNSGKVTPEERKALGSAGIWTLLYLALITAGIVSGVIMNPENGGLIGSPLLQGIVPVLFMLFIISGLAYGKSIGVLKKENDIQKALIKRMANMAPYIVMSFMAAQFIQLFTWSNLGALLSIGGANGLASIGFTGLPLIVGFIILTALLDFLIGSGSAKWTLMGPIFVPMLALLGISPAFTQMAYRIGDSVSNVMSPTSAFLYMMLGEAQTKYDPDCTLGTFLSCQFLFFISSLIAWIILVVIWVMLNLPLGPGYTAWL